MYGFGKDVLKPLKDKPLPDMKQLAVVDKPNQTKGKIMLLCFFDMEQRPSRNCLRQLSERAKELKTKDIVIVAVQSSEVAEKTFDEWIEKSNLPFSVGMIVGDEEKTRFNWGVRSLPWLILTDRQHIVTAEGFSIDELDGKISSISEN